jgi:hypothetical protein
VAAPTLLNQGSLNGVTTGTRAAVFGTHAANDILVVGVMLWAPNTAGTLADFPSPTGSAIWNYLGRAKVGEDGQVGYWWGRATGAGMTFTIGYPAGADDGTDTLLAVAGDIIRGCVTTGDPFDQAIVSGPHTTANVQVPALTVSGVDRLAYVLAVHMDNLTQGTVTDYTAGTARSITTGTDCSMRAYTLTAAANVPAKNSIMPVGWDSGSRAYAYLVASFRETSGLSDQNGSFDTATLTLAGVTPPASGSGDATGDVGVAALALTAVAPGVAATSVTATLATAWVAFEEPLTDVDGNWLTDSEGQPLTGLSSVELGAGYAISDQNGSFGPATLSLSAVEFAGLADQAGSFGPATLTLSAVELASVASGNASVAFDTATLALAAQTPSVATSGNGDGSFGVAALALAAQTPTAAASGDGTGTFGVAILALAAVTPGATVSGSATSSLDPAALSLSAIEPGAAVSGNAPATLDPAALVLTAVELTASGGGNQAATLDPALLSLSAITPGTTVIGDASGTFGAATVTLAPVTPGAAATGDSSGAFGVAQLTLAADLAGAAAGSVVAPLDPAQLVLQPLELEVVATGDVAAVLAPALLTLLAVGLLAEARGADEIVPTGPFTLTLAGLVRVLSGLDSEDCTLELTAQPYTLESTI